MKRITILSSAEPRIKRGLQVVAHTHAKSLRKRGFDAILFCPHTSQEVFELEGVPVYTFSYNKGKYSPINFANMMHGCWRGWQAHFGDQEPSVLHGHDHMTFYFLSRYLSRNVKKIFTVHDPFIYHHRMLGTLPHGGSIKERMMSHIENTVYMRSDKIHCISEYTRIRLPHHQELASKIRIIPDWIDTDIFVLPTDKALVRTILNVPSNAFVIYTLRALQQRMGIANLIQAFALVKGKIPQAELIIGGKGPLRKELEELTIRLGLSQCVNFLGYVPDSEVVMRYQSADVVIMPSIDGEGFGLPVLEAMACGTPVLATPACALPEVLSGKPERLFSGLDPKSIAAGILDYYRQWQDGIINANLERDYVLKRYNEEDLQNLILKDYGINSIS